MIRKIFVIFLFIYFFITPKTYATDEIIQSQMETLNISSFIREGQTYTKEVFPNINLNELLNSAIKGKIDNNGIFNEILLLFGKEFSSTFSLIGSIIVIIVIHSILKGFSDNLDGNGVKQIAYYVEYILVVTLIMANFSSTINLIKETISNLVGFTTTLIPILLSLIVASRQCSFNFINRTNNIICNSFYCKWYNIIYITYNIYCCCTIYSI